MQRTTNPLPQLIFPRACRIAKQLRKQLWQEAADLPVELGPTYADPVPWTTAQATEYRPLPRHSRIGTPQDQWGQAWLRTHIPAAAPAEAGRRYLLWDGQGELNVYVDGRLWCGIDPMHPRCPLPDVGGELHLALGMWLGTHPQFDGLTFTSASLALRNDLVWDALWDLEVLLELVAFHYKREYKITLHENSGVGFQHRLEEAPPLLRLLLHELNAACEAFDREGLADLHASLRALYARIPAEPWQPKIEAVGHAHIDLVWLWPEGAINQKGLHTFATQLRLLERYPEFVFLHTSPALYRAVEQLEPPLMDEIRGRIHEGRWEATGALEVELDTQLPCGESIVRSVRVGQRKFIELRGEPSSVCWIPDVFGYSACLPQVLAGCGVPYFYTTKMTWSTVTRFPYNSFVWRGSDGSEVLTQLCSTSYVAQGRVTEWTDAIAGHRESAQHPELLVPHGFGDGGGGVTEDILERVRRLSNLAGLPRGGWGGAEAFFQRMESSRADLPVYQGELYLEYHRGTYTTQSEFKRLHRATERALQSLEAVRAARGTGPLEDAAWTRHLFTEFHDALPGSSIGLVYKQLLPEMAENAAQLESHALRELNGAEIPASLSGWFNPLAFTRRAVVPQPSTGELACIELAGLSAGKPVEPQHPVTLAQNQSIVLDNGLLRAEFDCDGQLIALGDETGALTLTEPAGLALHHDHAHLFDAWDIDHYVLAHPEPAARQLNLTIAEQSPLRIRLRGESPLGEDSHVVINYILDADSPWLRVELELEWRERHRLLKYYVPTSNHGRFARFGNPFGSILRPQWPGVQADEAMWEVPGARWAAVTHDDNSGLALVSEAKYGFSCKEGVLGLSLLRAPTEPDLEADQGRHVIRFAIGRHRTRCAGLHLSTAAAAEALFTPPLPLAHANSIPAAPFTFESLDTLTPSWVEPLDGGGMTLRLHETAGEPGTLRLRLASDWRAARVDLNGNESGQHTFDKLSDDLYSIPFTPYQIVSLSLTPEAARA